MWHSAVHTDPLHHMAHNVVCVMWWSGSAYTTCALIMSAVSTDPLHSGLCSHRLWDNKFSESGKTRLRQAVENRKRLADYSELYLYL